MKTKATSRFSRRSQCLRKPLSSTASNKRFTFAYIFAAVEPGTDNAFALVMPYVNTEAMQVFLDRFAATIGDDEHVAMVLDQAGLTTSAGQRAPAPWKISATS